jgi:hypothetical protein
MPSSRASLAASSCGQPLPLSPILTPRWTGSESEATGRRRRLQLMSVLKAVSVAAIHQPGGGSWRSQVTSAGWSPDQGAWTGGSPDSPPGGASPGPDCSRGIPTASGRPHRAGTRSSRHARSDRSAARGTHDCSRPNADRCSRPLGSWPSPSHLWPSAGRWHRGDVVHPGSRDYVPLGGIRHPPTVSRSAAGDGRVTRVRAYRDLDASSRGLLRQLRHDRQMTTGAGAHDQPTGGPGDLLVGGQGRVTVSVTVALRWLLLPTAHVASVDHDSRSKRRPSISTSPKLMSLASTAGD